MQALNAQYAFGREPDFRCQAAMERPQRQAGLSSQLFHAIAAVKRQAGGALFSGPYAFEKVGDDCECPAAGS